MSKFTSGKWICFSEKNIRGNLEKCNILSLQGSIAHVIGTINTEEDARLVTAAPELYELVMDELRGEAGGMFSFAREAKIKAVLDRIDGKEEQE